MKRLDQYLLKQGYVSSRSKAQDAIHEGRVFVEGKCIRKNAFLVNDEMHIELKDSELSFVSRAGFKLYDALQDFEIDLQDKIVIDVGASTGGFSDVCLKEGAKLVYAVDVGRDQLVQELREHPQVIEMSECNCRYLKRDMFEIAPNFACMDVSFISITYILPALIGIMDDIEMVVLIKPQFEAGKDAIGKHGIIKHDKIHIQVLRDMMAYVQSLGLSIHHLQASSILGRDGNKEFIMHLKKDTCHRVFDIMKIVKEDLIKR